MTQTKWTLPMAVVLTAMITMAGTYVMVGQMGEEDHNLVMTGSAAPDLGPYVFNELEEFGGFDMSSTEISRFSSFSELREMLDRHASTNYYYYDYRMLGGISMDGAMMAESAAADSSGALGLGGSSSSNSYTSTNIQVVGVDEGDIVKTDGTYAYVISADHSSVFIIQAYPADESCIISEIAATGSYVDMYINGQQLIMLEQAYYFEGGYRQSNYMYSDRPVLTARVFDIGNRSAPQLVREASMNSYYLTSRLIDGTLYLVGNQYLGDWQNESQLPMPLDMMYQLETGDDVNSLTSFMVLDLEDADSTPSVFGIVMDSTNNIYVSENNFYITHMKDYGVNNYWNEQYDPDANEERTVIHRLGIQGQGLKYKARGEVPGRLLNRYSMDEFHGHFRVATTKGWTWGSGEDQSRSMVYVLDMALEPTGTLDGIAPGETIYSARFIGDRCYLVTFRQVDPFFVIDLHDAESPQMLGELHIPGYSSYLHPYDENHIIGLGKDGGVVKLSLFDVTNVTNPTELDKVTIGESYSDSMALSDPHAFTFDPERNLLVLPIYTHGDYDYYSGYTTTNAAYVFEITPENGIVQKGQVEHDSNPDQEYYYYYRYDQVKRSFFINDTLYTVSNYMMKANAVNGLGLLATVDLS